MPRKKQPLIVGLTGSIGSGKSEAAKAFRELGALVIDADILAREAVLPGSPAHAAIAAEFGTAALDETGAINRKALGRIVFADPRKRAKLEGIVHPDIRKLFRRDLAKILKNPDSAADLIVYIAPLLFESKNAYPELAKVIVVSAPRETCIERIMQRDGSTRELAEKKFDSQLPPEKKEKLADIVIKNDGDVFALWKKVGEVHASLTAPRGG